MANRTPATEVQGARASLAAPIDHTASQLTVELNPMTGDDADSFPEHGPFTIKIEDEIIGIGKRSGAVFSQLTRGKPLTRSHPVGADVFHVVTGETLAASGSTDEVFHFVQTADAPPAFPIIAKDDDSETITVSGDATPWFFDLGGAELNQDATYLIVGSEGDDGQVSPGATPVAVYDRDSDTTVISFPGGFSGPAGGHVQPLSNFIEYIEIPPGGAVEWVFVDVISAWVDEGDTAIGYLWIGDSEDGTAFVNLGTPGGGGSPPWLLQSPGKYQWPLKTLGSDIVPILPGSDGDILPSSLGYKLYPDGGRVQIVIQGAVGSVGGDAIIIVHHHYGDVAAPSPGS